MIYTRTIHPGKTYHDKMLMSEYNIWAFSSREAVDEYDRRRMCGFNLTHPKLEYIDIDWICDTFRCVPDDLQYIVQPEAGTYRVALGITDSEIARQNKSNLKMGKPSYKVIKIPQALDPYLPLD